MRKRTIRSVPATQQSRNGLSPEAWKKIMFISDGALAVARRWAALTTPGSTPGVRRHREAATPIPELVKLAATAKFRTLGITAQIRAAVLAFPAAPAARIGASLPHINHNTIGSIVSSVKRSLK